MSVHVLGEVAIDGVDQFLAVFASEGYDKRWEHGCLGADVFSPAGEVGTVLVLMEFPDLDAFEGFRTDPTAPPIMRKGGAQGPPTYALLERAASFEH